MTFVEVHTEDIEKNISCRVMNYIRKRGDEIWIPMTGGMVLTPEYEYGYKNLPSSSVDKVKTWQQWILQQEKPSHKASMQRLRSEAKAFAELPREDKENSYKAVREVLKQWSEEDDDIAKAQIRIGVPRAIQVGIEQTEAEMARDRSNGVVWADWSAFIMDGLKQTEMSYERQSEKEEARTDAANASFERIVLEERTDDCESQTGASLGSLGSW